MRYRPMTLTLEHDKDNVKMNQQPKYLNQKSFSSTGIAQKHIHTHTHSEQIALPAK